MLTSIDTILFKKLQSHFIDISIMSNESVLKSPNSSFLHLVHQDLRENFGKCGIEG